MSRTLVENIRSENFGYRDSSKFTSAVLTIHRPSTCRRSLRAKSIHSRSSAYKDKEDRKIENKYFNPSKNLAIYPKVLTEKEYESLKERGRTIAKTEREATAEATEKEKERLTKESMARKETIRRIDIKKKREKDPRTMEIEEEARKRTMHILERAHNMRLEQDEEIQKCNRLILESKCRAIRDAQIAEKKLIERELLEEEVRLNDMMENERRWAIKEELRREQGETVRRLQFAKILKEQIVENEEQRIIEFERKQEESRLINLNNIAWQRDEIEKLRNKQLENARVRQELSEGNEQLKHYKAMEQEENRLLDLRIQDYQRQKEEREATKSEEQKLENLKKEREKARIAAQAMQAHDLQAQIDEINAARIQEQVERQWRQKEKEEAVKKLQAQKILQKEREEQINNKRIMQAIEIERNRREFEKIVRVQQAAFCRDKKELEEKQQKALNHRDEILKQIKNKERERIVDRQKMFEEGLEIRAKIATRNKKLQDAMERKCQEMKDNKVPDIYINEVKRMIECIE